MLKTLRAHRLPLAMLLALLAALGSPVLAFWLLYDRRRWATARPYVPAKWEDQ